MEKTKINFSKYQKLPYGYSIYFSDNFYGWQEDEYINDNYCHGFATRWEAYRNLWKFHIK